MNVKAKSGRTRTSRGAARRAAPLRSMTGMGAGRAENADVAVEVELRATNGRFLDLQLRLPRGHAPYESDLRAVLSKRLSRGRIELTAVRTPKRSAAVGVEFRKPVFDALLRVGLGELARAGANDSATRAALVRDVLSRREVLDVAEGGESSPRERSVLLAALDRAVTALLAMREREGASLATDLEARRAALAGIAASISALRERAPERYRERLLANIRALAPEVTLDESRLAAEVAYLADRSDIAEELTRISSHLDQMEHIMRSPPCGKRLDFITQELAREFNTIGSKAQDAGVQAAVVDAKAEIERIREQVQNIE